MYVNYFLYFCTDLELDSKSVKFSCKIMIYRELTSELLRIGTMFPVVILTGPRQSGKTTLCKMAFPEYKYYNIENPDTREIILSDPITFLKSNSGGMILDEAQRLPELFSYIQVLVDEDKTLRYVLSGSNNFTLMEKITQSLAGRAALLTLLPLSIKEINSDISSDELMLNGFYPAVWGDGRKPFDVYSNYYRTYVERDLRQLINIKDLDLFRQFVRLMASRVANEFNASRISNEIGVDIKTVQHWLSILTTSYIAFTLPPYYRNIGKRIVKAHKLYFYETGLVSYLLGLETPEQVALHPLRGAMFENMVVSEFYKRRFNQGMTPHLFYYRDNSQKEIDLIEEQTFGQLNIYEIKSAKRFNTQFYSGIDYFKKIYGESVVGGTVLYDGDETVAIGEKHYSNWKTSLLSKE